MSKFITRIFEKVKGAPKDTVLPTRATEHSAGYDFVAPADIVIPAGGVSGLVFTNVKCGMRANEFLMLVVRSSLAVKHQITFESSGIIDSDYYSNKDNDGNIGINFRNNGTSDYVIKKGERCVQGIFIKYLTTENDTANMKRIGGYGSSGK